MIHSICVQQSQVTSLGRYSSSRSLSWQIHSLAIQRNSAITEINQECNKELERGYSVKSTNLTRKQTRPTTIISKSESHRYSPANTTDSCKVRTSVSWTKLQFRICLLCLITALIALICPENRMWRRKIGSINSRSESAVTHGVPIFSKKRILLTIYELQLIRSLVAPNALWVQYPAQHLIRCCEIFMADCWGDLSAELIQGHRSTGNSPNLGLGSEILENN